MPHDLRHAARTLLQSPGFTSVAVLTLALGIGANSTLFSVVEGVLLRPLPYPDADRLVMLWETNQQSDLERSQVSPVTFTEWRGQEQLFDGMAGWWYPQINLTDDNNEPERARTIDVTDTFFEVMGVEPVRGRGFVAGEDLPGAERVVIIGHDLWQRRFGGSDEALGATVWLDDRPHTVVGIAPKGFDYPEKTSVWRPLGWDPAQHSRSARFFEVVARLRPDVTVTQAQTEITALGRRLEEDYPDSNTGWGAKVVSLHEQLVGDVAPALYLLLGAVALVLLVACSNVANLLLARAFARQREMAIRIAMGANGRDLLRQVLTESLLLAFLATLLGLGFAWVALRILVATNPMDIPRLENATLNPTVLLFTVLLAILTAIVFGLVPALQLSRSDPSQSLKEGTRTAGASVGRRHARLLLVAVEVAMALMLLIGAALLLQSFARLQHVDTGFTAGDAITFSLQLPAASYPEWLDVSHFYQELVDRLSTVPGVDSAAVAAFLPFDKGWPVPLDIVGRPPAEPGHELQVQYHWVSRDYFQTLGVPLLSGRAFEERDDREAPTVVLLSQEAARRYFPDENPVGKRLATVGRGIGPLGRILSDSHDVEIIGVVGDVKNTGLDTEAEPALYFHQRQYAYRSMNVVVRSKLGFGPTVNALREVVRALDPALPISDLGTLEERTAERVAQPRFSMLLLGLLALLATLLAAVGLYAVMAHSVLQRQKELGLRLALGARRADILRLVVAQGMRWCTLGVVVGLLGAAALSGTLRTLLYGVTPTDGITWASVVVLLLLVALVASLLPARRASRIEPLIALRSD